MKNARILTISLFLALILTNSAKAFADDFIMPDWSFYKNREQTKIENSYEKSEYQKVRKEQNFDKFFDKQTIIIHKREKMSPKSAAERYLNLVQKDKYFEKYILDDSENNFFAIYCSSSEKKCEILRYTNGFDGLVEIKYTHNNLWHFQNNIGSFLEVQNRIIHIPYEFTINKLTDKNRLIRL